MIADGGAEDLFVALSLNDDDPKSDRKIDNVENVFEVDGFMPIDVVFGFGGLSDWGADAFEAILLVLKEIHCENDLLQFSSHMVCVHA